MIIGPWYLIRLMQWRGLARDYPQLLQPTTIKTSLPAKFQSSKVKLIIGLAFGAFMLVMLILFVVASIGAAAAAAAANQPVP